MIAGCPLAKDLIERGDCNRWSVPELVDRYKPIPRWLRTFELISIFRGSGLGVVTCSLRESSTVAWCFIS